MKGASIESPIRPKAKNGSGWVANGYHYVGTPEGKKLSHRLLMEQALGRSLLAGEQVHHKNGDRSDNRLTPGHELARCPTSCCNLELWSKAQPSGQRVADKIDFALEILRTYAPETLKPRRP